MQRHASKVKDRFKVTINDEDHAATLTVLAANSSENDSIDI